MAGKIMRTLMGLCVVLALVLSTFTRAWADCNFNEAEALNGRITVDAILSKSSDEMTPEIEAKIDGLREQYNRLNVQHTAAIKDDDQDLLNSVCEGYRAMLDQIAELTAQLQ